MSNQLPDYDAQALADIRAFKNPTPTTIKKILDKISWPIDKVSEGLMAIPGIEWAIGKSVGGLVSLLNDFAQWSVRTDAIYEEFRKNGHDRVNGPGDIRTLKLEEIDRVVGFLAAKYKMLAAAEGTAAGLASAAGIPADVVAIVALNLRAIGEYATYYGFDITKQQEQLFAMGILGLASSPNDAAKSASMAHLTKLAGEVAKKRSWKELEKSAFVKIVQQIAKALGIRLTKAKLAQIIPVASAGIGGGYNAYYTAKVCAAAYFLYRERFLAERYGDQILANQGKGDEQS